MVSFNYTVKGAVFLTTLQNIDQEGGTFVAHGHTLYVLGNISLQQEDVGGS